MKVYNSPELRGLGSFASLTLGMNGSCPDGGGRNNTQLGGGSIGGTSDVECGPGTGSG